MTDAKNEDCGMSAVSVVLTAEVGSPVATTNAKKTSEKTEREFFSAKHSNKLHHTAFGRKTRSLSTTSIRRKAIYWQSATPASRPPQNPSPLPFSVPRAAI